ncbi:MAG: EAL domain-containing protein, partial [Acidimicrobiia bacterium]|nr:EAL domain-containing protein [Acidimicrobiia bacterium]
ACYPTVSVFLVALTARIAATSGRRPSPAQHLLLAAMSALLVGDVVYMVVDAQLVDLPERLVDVPYALAYLAFSLCVLHPSMRELTVPLRSDEAGPTRGRLVLVAVSLGIPTVVLLSRRAFSPGDREVLALVVGGLTTAAVWRVFRALRAHAEAEARLAHQATHDTLTGLPNRALLAEHLERLLRRTTAPVPPVAVLFLDVDRFKLVNDTGGHNLGDELLVAIARRFSEGIGPGDLVARIGGDEFVLVLASVADEAEALAAAEQVRRGFERPFLIRGAEIYASASVGVAVAGPGSDAETLVRDADTAMYQAKAAGRDGSALFDLSMRHRVAERLGLEQDLRNALAAGELRVAYQPVVQLADRRVLGFEALVRWEHPRVGSVPPSVFVPVAEDTGLIGEIGTWVVEQACLSLAAWQRAVPGAAGLYVGVNLSARQLRDPGLGRMVTDALGRHGLAPSTLCLELTESLLMDDPVSAAEVLRGVRDAGVRLALDDFGTGYSSLAYLRRFPVDEVKIDRSFVESLAGPDSAGESLVTAIVAMAAALGVATVAEGVETAGEARRLAELGVDRGQGYFYCPPVSPERVPEVLTARGPGRCAPSRP